MNLRKICEVSGKVLVIEALCMFLALCVSMIYADGDTSSLLLSMSLTAFTGFLLSSVKSSSTNFFAHDGFLTVGAAWILVSLFGALPYLFSGYFGSYLNCFFESVSGFTTTGATVLTDIEAVPRGILFWRSFTNWLGGMGVLILFIALIPKLGGSTQFIMRAESPGPSPSKLVPKISDSSKILYAIYLTMTVIMIVALIVSGMPAFDSIVVAMSAGGTGGFAVKNLSIGGYTSPAWQGIVGVFMLLFGVNFAVYYFLLTKRLKQALRSLELKFYAFAVAASVILISFNISHLYDTAGQAVRFAFFQVSTMITTTGFTTENYDIWPEFSKTLLFILMIMGACSGSTSGGVKGLRVIMLFKLMKRELWQIIHPRGVKVISIDGKGVPESTLTSAVMFICGYIFVFLFSVLALSLDNFSFMTSFSAVISAISNVGPGFDLAGPLGNYSAFSPFSKIILMLCMLAGRLEIIPMLVLFDPQSWKKT